MFAGFPKQQSLLSLAVIPGLAACVVYIQLWHLLEVFICLPVQWEYLQVVGLHATMLFLEIAKLHERPECMDRCDSWQLNFASSYIALKDGTGPCLFYRWVGGGGGGGPGT